MTSTRTGNSSSSASLVTRYVRCHYKQRLGFSDCVDVMHRNLQFGGQEPGTNEEIAQFCELNHGVTFPLMAKSDVNGDNTNEVYKWLKSQKSGLLGLTRIKVRSLLISWQC